MQGEWGEGRGSKQNDTTFLPRYPGKNIRIVKLGSMSLFSSPADLYPPPPSGEEDFVHDRWEFCSLIA